MPGARSVVWWFIPMCSVSVSGVRLEIEVPTKDGINASTVRSCSGSEGTPGGRVPGAEPAGHRMACPAVVAALRRVHERSAIQADSSDGQGVERRAGVMARRAAHGDAHVIVGDPGSGRMALKTRHVVVG